MAVSVRHQRVIVPVQNGAEVVEIHFSDLPSHYEDIIELFKAELAPLPLWLDVAKAYLELGQVQQFLGVLRLGTSDEVKFHYGDAGKPGRVQFLCALGAYHMTLAATHTERAARQTELTNAFKYFSEARGTDYQELLPHLGLGQISIAQVRIELW